MKVNPLDLLDLCSVGLITQGIIIQNFEKKEFLSPNSPVVSNDKDPVLVAVLQTDLVNGDAAPFCRHFDPRQRPHFPRQ